MDQSGSRPVANELLWSFLMPELNLITEAEEKKMEKRDYDKEIQELTKAAEEYVETVKDQIAALADEGGVQAYWGEYGENGQTYYPKGTDIEEYYLGWRASEYADAEGKLTQGIWVSSSEMC